MVLLIIILLIAFAFIGTYNSLVAKRNMVKNAFAGIDVQLKKRYDLIPNLVESVKGYMKHEESVLTKLVQLRNTPYSQMDEAQKGELDNTLRQFVNGLRVTVEQYPDLKASANFMHLQRTLNETEEQLAAARRSFNAAVTDYNTSIQTFPTNLLAGLFGFTQKNLLENTPEERKNVEVKF